MGAVSARAGMISILKGKRFWFWFSLSRPNRLHNLTHSPKRPAHPRSPMHSLSALTARATHALQLHPEALASLHMGLYMFRFGFSGFMVLSRVGLSPASAATKVCSEKASTIWGVLAIVLISQDSCWLNGGLFRKKPQLKQSPHSYTPFLIRIR